MLQSRWIVLLVVLVLAGCQTAQPRRWTHSDPTPERMGRDHHECTRFATAPAYRDDAYVVCMKARGWKLH